MGGVNLVEIDLLRGGERFFPEYKDRRGKCLSAPYAACIRRAIHPSRYAIYSFQLRERLPAIRVPLRKQDPDVWLELQGLYGVRERQVRRHRLRAAAGPAVGGGRCGVGEGGSWGVLVRLVDCTTGLTDSSVAHSPATTKPSLSSLSRTQATSSLSSYRTSMSRTPRFLQRSAFV